MYCWVIIFALSPFLYLDLYILGDDAWISSGSFMCYLCLVFAMLSRLFMAAAVW